MYLNIRLFILFTLQVTASASTSVKGKQSRIDKCATSALTTEFAAGFKQPHPPAIQAEFTTSFVQHKW